MVFDYVYANLYNWYYRMVQNGRKVDPQNLTAMLFGICACGWFLLLLEIYLRIEARNNIHISYLFYGLLTLLISGIVSSIYSKNDRYQKVFEQYITSNTIENKRKAVLLSIGFIFFPFILFLAVRLF
jgi:hypothetical protein